MAPLRFMKGMLGLSWSVKLWLGILMLVNAVLPLLFLDRLEARVILATFLASFLLMLVLTARTGFSRLLGLGHVLWIPLVGFLLTRIGQVDGAVQPWLISVVILNSISLVIDAVDVVRYLRGERSEVVATG